MSNQNKRRESLLYHAKPRPGKIEVVPTKKYASQRDLALAYSPWVAEPCLGSKKIRAIAINITTKGILFGGLVKGPLVLGFGIFGPKHPNLLWKERRCCLRFFPTLMCLILK